MSEEEFNFRMNTGLEAYYGSGWKNIRKYLDLICELSDNKHHHMFAYADEYFDFNAVAEKADYIDSLWEDTLEKASGNEEITKRIILAQHSWIFLRQSAINDRVVNYGTDEEKAAYAEANRELLEYIETNNILWCENEKNIIDNYGDFTSPQNW